MAENKTKPTNVSPATFIAAVPSAQQRKDAKELVAMMRAITGERPKMWGPSIIGFGVHRYQYASGRKSEICLTGFSPRKPSLVLYLGEVIHDDSLMSRLGKFKTGKGCLYIKTLDDVDRDVLRTVIAKAVDRTRRLTGD